MTKRMSLAFVLMLSLTACSPRVGIGFGGVVASGDDIAASGVYADTQGDVHGGVSMGTTMGL